MVKFPEVEGIGPDRWFSERVLADMNQVQQELFHEINCYLFPHL